MQYIRKANKASFTFELTNCDGTPVDLSTSTLKFIVKKNKTDEDSTAVLSGEVDNSTTNIVSFEFTAQQTDLLNEGEYFIAIKIVKPDHMDDEVWNDNLKVVREVFSD